MVFFTSSIIYMARVLQPLWSPVIISDIDEPVSKCSILCEIKEGKKINHRNTLKSFED